MHFDVRLSHPVGDTIALVHAVSTTRSLAEDAKERNEKTDSIFTQAVRMPAILTSTTSRLRCTNKRFTPLYGRL